MNVKPVALLGLAALGGPPPPLLLAYGLGYAAGAVPVRLIPGEFL